MENSPKSGFPWNFTTVVTAQGYCYVKAYKMKWDPVLKKSKRHLQRHVGRLLEDDRIKISPKFSADFPEYSGDDWFWGANKKPVREAEYRQDFPATPGPAPEDEDACNPQATLDVGLTWAAMQVAENSGIRSHLHKILVHLGSPWNAALTFKKKSGRLPPRKKSSAHSKFQADSSY